MNAASYSIAGTGPNSATFTAASTGASVTENSLAFGSWTIVVNATNAAGQLIGTGSSTAQVNTGETTIVSVNVAPILGTGTLSLGVSWPAAQVQTPSINASLTPALGSAQVLPFTISGATASYSNAAVGNGYYTLAFTLLDNASVVAGAVDVVRIVTGQTTSGTYAFSNVNAPGGTIAVNINANMQNPLDVAIAGASATLSQGTTEGLTASVTNFSGNVVYVWYVNGVSVGTGASYTFGANQPLGYYRIDVTAFTADGTRAGSCAYNIQVTSPSQVYAIGDIGPAGGHVFYDQGSYINGWRYLEAAPTSQNDKGGWFSWYNGVFLLIPGAAGTDIGAGKANTAAIIAAQGPGNYAASICSSLSLNGFSDWFLPSRDELNAMSNNLYLHNPNLLGSFDIDDGFISSSQATDHTAWGEDLPNPNVYYRVYTSSNGCYIWAVREF
jgi:hypothetical protein